MVAHDADDGVGRILLITLKCFFTCPFFVKICGSKTTSKLPDPDQTVSVKSRSLQEQSGWVDGVAVFFLLFVVCTAFWLYFA